MTLTDIFNNPEYDELLKVDNSEYYGEWLIYTQDGNTIASKLIDSGIYALSVKGTGEQYTQAMKIKIDSLK